MVVLVFAGSLAACCLAYRIGQRTSRRPLLFFRRKSSIAYFVSGVMGGSGEGKSNLSGVAVESQDYRAQMREAILAADPTATIVDPAELVKTRSISLHPSGPVDWSSDIAVATMFGECCDLAARCDVIISYLPSASMGSAVELHAAHESGKLVLVVAPGENMKRNWVIRVYADHVFDSIEELRRWLLENPTNKQQHHAKYSRQGSFPWRPW